LEKCAFRSRKIGAVVEKFERFFVITGGPGSGKTTLLDALEKAGYRRSIEAGRAVIQHELSIGGDALPWGDRVQFAERMLAREILSYEEALPTAGPVFFDRGVPDVIGYLRLVGKTIPEPKRKAAKEYRYNRCAYIAPPWQEIFRQDQERKQDFAEAVRTYNAMVATYSEFGYELVEIPKISVAGRVKFVLANIGGDQG
jgi:predicted ATPase